MHELTSDPAAKTEWERLRPEIDHALHALSDRDREAVLLRFFEGRAFPEVGARLCVTADAARLRVERALVKMRVVLARRGLDSTTAALAVALANQPAVAVPVGLATAVTGAALAGTAVAGGGGVVAAFGAFLAMSKIKIGIVSAIVVAAIVPAVVEVRANRALQAEFNHARAGRDTVAALQKENQRLTVAMSKVAANNPDFGELTRLRQRAAVLKARPEGVVESEMKPASTWRNAGRETPQALLETFCHAVFTGDCDLVASLIGFSDGSEGSRAAFMAQFSAAVRARYPTPERLVAAALFPGSPDKSPNDAFQMLDVRNDRRPGQVRVRFWIRAGGRESEGSDRYAQTRDGWAIAPFALSEESFRKELVARFDPATGEPLRPRK